MPNVPGVWLTAMNDHAQPPLLVSDDTFYLRCHDVVTTHFSIDLSSEVTYTNGVPVYMYNYWLQMLSNSEGGNHESNGEYYDKLYDELNGEYR